VRFTRGYVTAPQCTPSRAALITGRYQNRFGVEQNFDPMPSEVVTLPERLRELGYISGISGKWHLDTVRTKEKRKDHDPALAPHLQGFDEYFTGTMQEYSASHGLDGTPFSDAPRTVTEKGCRVVLQTDWALQFLKRRAAESEKVKQKQNPFFLYLAYMAPHTPPEFPKPWIDAVPQDLPRARRSALALIAAMDDGVGRLRRQLDDMGQADNTLIFFLADNGAPLGRAWDGSINLPMRGAKGMLSEGGIRVPFVAAWPGKIPGGQVFDHPVISLDIAPTALASAGQPSNPELDGVNLLPHLTGQTKAPPHETLYWRWVDQAAIQEFPYKLIQLGRNESLLFDITQPEGEDHTRELSEDHPEIANRLRAKLDIWLATLSRPGPPQPLHRASGYISAGLLSEK
jgi:arylsulfatase A-like enzyme